MLPRMSELAKPKLIALDLDGTLLNKQGEVSLRASQAIQALKAQGVKLVLSTGRPPRHVKALAEELDLSDLVVVYNGAAILNFKTNNVNYRHQMSRETVLGVLQQMRKSHADVMAGMETHHGWYLDKALFEQRKAGLTTRQSMLPDGCGKVEQFVQDQVIKVFFRHKTLTAPELSKALIGEDVYATWTSPSLLEVMAKHVNKQESIQHLSLEMGIKQEEVAAFGDQHNDKELLSWAGLGVAMGNASEEIKQAANLVTSSNNDEGVARVLERWV